MSHKSLRTIIENTVRSIHDDVQYHYGEETDFNQAKKKGWVMVNLSPLVANSVFADNNVLNYSKSWNVQMAFYKFDKQDNVNYGEILDLTDALVDKFVTKLNLTEILTISGINQTPFIKALADVLTGHLLTMTITLNDDFDYCVDC